MKLFQKSGIFVAGCAPVHNDIVSTFIYFDGINAEIYNVASILSTMPTNFVIMSPGRCGSNYLASLLASHGDALCHGEIFGKDGISFAGENYFRLNNLELRDKFPYLFAKYHLSIERNFKAVGFRLLFDQNQKALEKVIRDKKIKKIILLRRNELRRVTSAKLAELNQNWLSTKAAKINKIKANIDLEKFIEQYEWLERELKRHIAILEKTKQKYFSMYYEDLNNPSQQKKLLNYLNLPTHELSSPLIKQNPESLSELIENYEEVKSAFSGTKLHWMLDQDR